MSLAFQLQIRLKFCSCNSDLRRQSLKSSLLKLQTLAWKKIGILEEVSSLKKKKRLPRCENCLFFSCKRIQLTLKTGKLASAIRFAVANVQFALITICRYSSHILASTAIHTRHINTLRAVKHPLSVTGGTEMQRISHSKLDRHAGSANTETSGRLRTPTTSLC